MKKLTRNITRIAQAISLTACATLANAASPTMDIIIDTLNNVGSDSMKGRVIGTVEHDDARNWLADTLDTLNVTPAGDPIHAVDEVTGELVFDTDGKPVYELDENGNVKISYLQHFSAFLKGDDNNEGDVISGDNIMGILCPTNYTGNCSKPKVMLTAHYDGISSKEGPNGEVLDCLVINVDETYLPNGDQQSLRSLGFSDEVCNGAADNLTGVAAILSILKNIDVENLGGPVAAVFFDGEENHDGKTWIWGQTSGFNVGNSSLLGSGYFVNAYADDLIRDPFDVSELKLHINLEAIGFDLFTGNENHIVVAGAHSGRNTLANQVNAANADIDTPLDLQHIEYSMAQKRTDMEGFVVGGWEVPFVIFTNGPGSSYHTNLDQYIQNNPYNLINTDKVLKVAEVVSNLTVTAAGSNGYTFSKIPRWDLGDTTFFKPSYEVHQMFIELLDRILGEDDQPILEADAVGRETLEALRSKLQLKVDNNNWWNRFIFSIRVDEEIALVNELNTIFVEARKYTLRKMGVSDADLDRLPI